MGVFYTRICYPAPKVYYSITFGKLYLFPQTKILKHCLQSFCLVFGFSVCFRCSPTFHGNFFLVIQPLKYTIDICFEPKLIDFYDLIWFSFISNLPLLLVLPCMVARSYCIVLSALLIIAYVICGSFPLYALTT